MQICYPISRRKPIAGLIAAIGIAFVVATAHPIHAQLGQSGLNWQQRFLGIIPLVKPDPKDPVVVTVNGAPITAAEIADYAKTEARMINATSTEESKAVFRDAGENLINRQLLLQEARETQDRDFRRRSGQSRARVPDWRGGRPDRPPERRAGCAVDERGAGVDADRENARRRIPGGSRAAHRRADQAILRRASRPVRQGSRRSGDRAYRREVPAQRDRRAEESGGEKILKLYKQAVKSKDFAALAKQNSEDTESAPKGGELGYFRPGNCHRWWTRWCSRRRSGT